MLPKGARREAILDELEHAGGLSPTSVKAVSKSTGVPEADIYGVATFYHLLARPEAGRRVCQGLSCWLAGTQDVLTELRRDGHACEAVSCLGQCDRPRAAMIGDDLELLDDSVSRGRVTPDDPELPMNLGGADNADYAALKKVQSEERDHFIDALEASGLQGRGGAGFPAFIKWRAVRNHDVTERYVVCNADEGEPGTFKDREVMLRRPHLLVEGLAIAGHVVDAKEIIVYIRGEFQDVRRAVERALDEAAPHLGELRHRFRFVMGHGAYICGEETALLEALEGRRGMPRQKPPYPTDEGFRSKPTLMNNVETLACIPAIALRGGEWFKDQGRTEPGSKLYCVSGHVVHPGVYELPLGINVDELVDAAGGYLGTPQAFSPGGASSGFLPMSYRDTPLDFGSLPKHGSMLGSAGLVVLNDTVDMAAAALSQAIFFEEESCGQCAPCRIGTRMLRLALDRYLATGSEEALAHVKEVAWEMEEGSICGLGTAAFLPLKTAMRHFPETFGRRDGGIST